MICEINLIMSLIDKMVNEYKGKIGTISGISNLEPNKILKCNIIGKETIIINLKCRIDTNKELEYYKAGGILNFVLNEIISNAA